ncbi:MAG: hypothetical protein U0S50_08280 [Sphingopyxis sp.]|uniref:hypothetical protein n=1 Tax=Sphingopyxis sp. TaxID=1908224 RepID=UPI002ABD0552|nr:hypothetical protein [Sphingopyxis sp.]MDZ3831798.1 hypothetical protein [Sphingopyxis sp.]
MRIAFLIPPMMLLAACGASENEKVATDSADVTAGADGDGGQVQIKADQAGGKLKIATGGVRVDIDIPDISDFDISSDFDIDGVPLYPGSKITAMDINASDRKNAKDAVVTFAFTSPAAPEKAADWMAGKFAEKNVAVRRSGDTLTGADKDGDDFAISFAPEGAASKGEVRIVSK